MELDAVTFRRVRLRNQRLYGLCVIGSHSEECRFEGALAESGSLGSWSSPLERPAPASLSSLYRRCCSAEVDLFGKGELLELLRRAPV